MKLKNSNGKTNTSKKLNFGQLPGMILINAFQVPATCHLDTWTPATWNLKCKSKASQSGVSMKRAFKMLFVY